MLKDGWDLGATCRVQNGSGVTPSYQVISSVKWSLEKTLTYGNSIVIKVYVGQCGGDWINPLKETPSEHKKPI